jgi:hypothetical protein
MIQAQETENWPLLRKALKSVGRADLMGPRKRIGHKDLQRPGDAKKFLTKAVMPRRPPGKS